MPPRKSLTAGVLASPFASTSVSASASFSTPRSRSRPSTSHINPDSASKSTLKRSRSSRILPSTPEAGPSHPNGQSSKRKRGTAALSHNDEDHPKSETLENGQESQDKVQAGPVVGADTAETGVEVTARGSEEVKIDPEAELEAWQDFAHEHYEMIEQLPLELHRNFRLLKELDDGCNAQLVNLHRLIRNYANERIALEKPAFSKKESVPSSVVGDEIEDSQRGGVSTTKESHSATQGMTTSDDPTRTLAVTSGNEDVQMTESHDTADIPSETALNTAAAPIDTSEDVNDGEDIHNLVDGTQDAPGVPSSDGQGGLIVSLPLDMEDSGNGEGGEKSNPPRNGFPPTPTLAATGTGSADQAARPTPRLNDDGVIPFSAHQEETTESTESAQPHLQEEEAKNQYNEKEQSKNVDESKTVDGSGKSIQNDRKRKLADGPNQHLPEVARLAREVIRTAEEKVAVAVGAYNAIDRHIRALDSALTAQEASILLGLRPETLPSANVDDALNLIGDDIMGVKAGMDPTYDEVEGNINYDPNSHGMIVDGEGDEQMMTLGLGGGGVRRKKGRGKKGKKGKNVVQEVPQVEPNLNMEVFNIPADPNEPRYCYCHQVSYGQMIGCENEECEYEWFHLGCAGLTAIPTGKWYCDICAPKFGHGHNAKMGSGKGGAGRIAPKVGAGSGAGVGGGHGAGTTAGAGGRSGGSAGGGGGSGGTGRKKR